MLDRFKRLFERDAPPARWPEAQLWARSRGATVRPARDDTGFAIEGLHRSRPWRLEWGPPQRDYISCPELRIRADSGVSPALHMLVLSRDLMRSLEAETYERFTDQMETQINAATPEEMRWLVMYPKVSLTRFPDLRLRLGAVARVPLSGSRWLEGALSERLAPHNTPLLAGSQPFVLITSRGRLTLRIALPEPRADDFEQAITLFEAAMDALPAATEALGDPSSTWPSTNFSTWHTPGPDEPPQTRS